MATLDCFGWSLGPAAVDIHGSRESSILARHAHLKRDVYINRGLRLKTTSEKAMLQKTAHQMPLSFRGALALRERRKDKLPTIDEPWTRRIPGSSAGKSPSCRIFRESRWTGVQLQARLCEAPLTRARLPEPSELSRSRRRRRGLRSLGAGPPTPGGHGLGRPRDPPTTNRRDRLFNGMNELEAKLVNMSARNGNLILLAWSLNEEFQMIEKNVESLMEDMKNLHQDLKDLRFANDLLYLLKGDLDHVTLKRWPFMILNENFCENPQQEFNLII